MRLWVLTFAMVLTFLYIFIVMLIMSKGVVTALAFAGFLISLAVWIKADLKGD